MWAVILAGGSGKRLWPLSRGSFPKQFIDMNNSGSLLSNSIKRALALRDLKGILIVAGEAHLRLIDKTLEEYPDINCSVLVEPEARNTAPAIFAAAKYIFSQDLNSTMLIMPSDHYYDEEALVHSVQSVMDVKSENQLITFGIKPITPETGYGYIHHANDEQVLKKVILFKEKPDIETAKKYISTNEFYWNSGINIFDSSFIIQEFSNHQEESSKVELKFNEQGKFIRIEKDEFIELPNISIDYAILEKSSNTFTAEFLGKWTDLGSWHSMRELNLKSQERNAVIGANIHLEDSYDNFVYSKSRTIGISGISNVAIVDTSDALLITNLDKRENSNKILDKIIDSDKEIFGSNERVFRPWGGYESIDNGDNYQVKRIHVYPLEQLSVQKHFYRSERWTVIKGKPEIRVGDTTKTYKEGSMISIGIEEIHSLANPTNSDVEIIEVQLGSYLGEDDIVRYSDKYGRD